MEAFGRLKKALCAGLGTGFILLSGMEARTQEFQPIAFGKVSYSAAPHYRLSSPSYTSSTNYTPNPSITNTSIENVALSIDAGRKERIEALSKMMLPKKTDYTHENGLIGRSWDTFLDLSKRFEFNDLLDWDVNDSIGREKEMHSGRSTSPYRPDLYFKLDNLGMKFDLKKPEYPGDTSALFKLSVSDNKVKAILKIKF